ncbi:MAG TPA: hypothetical protein VG651_01255 [Stellaceae bacterium]|nr:hypothetical protein [Stellaceae bacterium]
MAGPIRLWQSFALCLAMLAVWAATTRPSAPQPTGLSDGEMLEYLVQSGCMDDQGRLTDRLATDPDCGNRRLLREDDPLPWRKHDWGGVGGPAAGWQASDAVLAERSGVSFVDQTFDFGAPAAGNDGRPDAFQRFDANDGGDAIMIIGDTASAFLTQDGGIPGLQWFIGPGCSQAGRGRYVSWVLFKSDVGVDWRSLVAELGDLSRDACPKRFNRAFTRYRRVTEKFPFHRAAAGEAPRHADISLPTIIVEHFDAASMAQAHALERFYYAQGFGKLRWEAWVTDSGKFTQADTLARSGRCPGLIDGTAPAAGWRMVDCRMWTNIVADPARAGWRVRDFGWPPLDLALQ